MYKTRNINGLTHEQNTERYEELFRIAMNTIFTIKEMLNSPNEIAAVIEYTEDIIDQVHEEYEALAKGAKKRA